MFNSKHMCNEKKLGCKSRWRVCVCVYVSGTGVPQTKFSGKFVRIEFVMRIGFALARALYKLTDGEKKKLNGDEWNPQDPICKGTWL